MAGRAEVQCSTPGHHHINQQQHYQHIFDNLLIDGKNSIYRSIYAGCSDQSFISSGYDYFVIFMRFMASYVNRFRPKSVHVFWDSPVENLWRKKIYPPYKEQRRDHDHCGIDIKTELKRQIAIAIQVLKHLNTRQYFVDGQEADDLIYAFVYSNCNNKNLIISSDSDMKQIIYRFANTYMFNPLSKKGVYEDKPDRDPAIIKSFIGDRSDNISGYYNIGKIKVLPLVDDPVVARKKFFESKRAISEDKQIVGSSLFERNRQIIDLGLSPYLYNNVLYVENRRMEPINYDLKQIESIIHKHKVHGFMAEASNLTFLFKYLV